MRRLSIKNAISWAILALLGGLLAPATPAAEGFSYELVRDFKNGNYVLGDHVLCGYAMNDLGQVAYQTADGSTDPITYRVYFWDGTTEQEVWSTQNPTGVYPQLGCSATAQEMGLNADGLISVRGLLGGTPYFPWGAVFLRPGQGVVGTSDANGPSGFTSSRGNLNELGRIGFHRHPDEIGWTSETDTLPRSLDGSLCLGGPTINASSEVAMLCERTWSGSPSFTLHKFSPGPSTVTETTFATWYKASPSPGINRFGYTAFTTDGWLDNEFRVILVDPDGSAYQVLADENTPTLGDGATNGTGGVWLDEFNQVLFSTSPWPEDALWVVDPVERDPLAVWRGNEPLELPDETLIPNQYMPQHQGGRFFTINAQGTTVFSLSFSRNAEARTGIFLAKPDPGLLPSEPIMPEPGDQLPDGWRIRRPIPGVITVRRTYVDPPVATGYTFTADPGMPYFESVAIPAPLPGGDQDFFVEFGGLSFPLEAGESFYFTDHIAQGTDTFRITGIDLQENLSPDDHFVSGLTWIGEPHPTEITFTMIPIVENTDDSDGDGVNDSNDNCTDVSNLNQWDTDLDGIGDVCDTGASPGEPDNLLVEGYDPVTGNITVSFDATCQASNYDLHFGLLNDVGTYGWSDSDCSIGNSGRYNTFNPGTGSYFFVVSGHASTEPETGGIEGSYGASSDSVPRPQNPTCLRVQDVANSCQ